MRSAWITATTKSHVILWVGVETWIRTLPFIPLFLKSKKRRLILNVSDLWPSAGFELGALKKNFGYSILKKMESFNYKSADVILGQSNEILEHVDKITSKPKLFLYRNFPEIEKWREDEAYKRTKERRPDLLDE